MYLFSDRYRYSFYGYENAYRMFYTDAGVVREKFVREINTKNYDDDDDDGTNRDVFLTPDSSIPELPPYIRFNFVTMSTLHDGNKNSFEEISKIHMPVWQKLRSAIEGSTLLICAGIGSQCFPTADKLFDIINDQSFQIGNCFGGYSLKIYIGDDYDCKSFIASLLQLPPICGKCVEVDVKFCPADVEIQAPIESIANWLNSNCEEEKIGGSRQIKERKLTIRVQNIGELIDRLKKVKFSLEVNETKRDG